MRCIAANQSVLTALDQNTRLPNDNSNDQTAMTNDIECMDIIQFADGWYSYPDLNTFNSDFLLDTLTIRVNQFVCISVFRSLIVLFSISNRRKQYLLGILKQIILLLFH